jgi:hypothetical protein
MITFSICDDKFDNRPVTVCAPNWRDFCEALAEQALIKAHPDRKLDTKLLSPAEYEEGARRGASNVIGWDWAGVDIDDKAADGTGWTFDSLVERLKAIGISYLVYTTTSHKPDAARLRALFPLSRMVGPGEFKPFWRSVNMLFGGAVDAQTKDICRLFVAPRSWLGVENRFEFCTDGDELDVDLLMEYFPVPAEDRRSPGSKTLFDIVGSDLVENPHRISDDRQLGDLKRSPLVTTDALRRALGESRGGRVFRFLMSAATVGLRRGYDVTEGVLEELGRELASAIGRQKDVDDIPRSAARALEFATANVARDILEERADRIRKLVPIRPIV